ncbi:MAG: ferrochelatase [Bacillus sp. (in: firmicutes)]
MSETAILLVNLGTPDTPDPSSIRTYLREFLSDKRVIDLPRWRWLPVLHGIILNVRPKKSALLYQSIWREEGSPMLLYSKKQQLALQDRFKEENVQVSLAMTYGNPSVETELEKLHADGVRKLIVIPMFPQYSSTTTASVWDRVQQTVSRWKDIPELVFIRDYPDHPKLIELLKRRVLQASKKYGVPDTLILSYHGIPKRYANGGDDYPSRCQRTTAALQSFFPDRDIQMSYQSQFGKEEWLQPSTSFTIECLAANGKKHVHIIAPSFTVDCLETLEELAKENRDIFLKAGGEQYHYLPAANDEPLFIDCLEELSRQYM